MVGMDRTASPGIVLVSHSAAIAEGLAAMAAEVAGGEVRIVAAGGGPDGTLGTDGGRVADAVREADAGAGVVILADIGSAVLSVRAVLNDGMAEGVSAVLADAPLVEGAIAAAVTASVGGDRDAVRAAAEDAWNVRKL
ncbi:MAG: phosphoenolpyruvate---glycerone phosphotransferase subunit DhaM [Gaiellales bacterium]|jgi:dihydroxyacetone kinase phosphotransfer subunit|nr:phosphoenolpyruvate---glycerone phosphotransferase subunit DhaM [Gaiellales bacterium]